MIAETERIPLKQSADGVILVGETRVPLDTVIAIFEQGATAEEIVQRFPTLDLADVYFSIGYYLRHCPVVEAYLHERKQHSDEVRKQNEQRFNPQDIREQLLARIARQKAGRDAWSGS